eukprot:403335317
MKTTFQRKLSVEFLDNLDLVKVKTSRAKKTLRSMISFMNERVNIEQKYAQSLHNLAKTGGVSISHSIIEYKNYEEQTMRDAVNSLINFTIQESELHKEFALQTRTNIVQVLDETRKNLSSNKKNWLAKLDQLKKQIRESNEMYKREYLKHQQQSLIVEDFKKKRNEQYLKYGLSLDEQLQFDNMPKPIQQAEQKYQEAITKFNEIKKATQAQQEYTERCVSDFNKGSSDILEQIEKQEFQRLDVLKQNLNSFSVQIVSLVQQHESLHKLIEQEFANVDPMKDLQLFIQKNSTFAENERLRNLYKEMGLYQPISEDISSHKDDKNRHLWGSGLLVEKTSRAMAQQLKQMEEDRKRKALEEENHKKEQQRLKKCQSIVNSLKDTRELLYKIGNQVINYQNIDCLYQARPGASQEFKIGSKSTIDQLVYLLMMVYKPISTNNLQKTFEITDEMTLYLDQLIRTLSQNKSPDLFQILHRIFEHYKQQETASGNKFFEHQMSPKEKEFYKSVLGFAWTWIRLIVMRNAAYNSEQYEKDLNSFIDQVELEHHQSAQCTLEAIEFTFNAMKYVQKLSKKESLTLCFPLNFLLHQTIIPLYLDESNKNKNSLLSLSFQDHFLNLQAFSEKILGVKQSHQLMQLMRHIFNENLRDQINHNFSEFSELQNKSLYSMKYLIQKISKEHPSSLNQRTISVELVKEKNIEEPLNFFSSKDKEPAKLLSVVNNCWLMSDICKDLFKILENYDTNFGECYNKLRLILDFTSLCFRQSFVFISDGSFQERLKQDILIKAGERRAKLTIESEGFELPFALSTNQVSRKSQMAHNAVSKTSIIEVINKFTVELQKEEVNYNKVWDSHLLIQNSNKNEVKSWSNSQNQTGVKEEKNYENAIFYFGQKMSQIIEEDLALKLEDMDFDKDPHQVVGKIIQSLQNFDSVSRRKTLNVIRPKLESWLQLKLVNIRELVSKTIQFENWSPSTESVNFSESVVNVFYVLNENIENLYEFLGKEIFLRWSKCIQVMIHDCIFEYCNELMKGLDNTSQYKPSDVLPPLNLMSRKGKKQGQFTISKKANIIEYTPDMFNKLVGMGNKNWVDLASCNDQTISLQKLLTRLANVDYIYERLEDMKIRFFSLTHPKVDEQYENTLFKSAEEMLFDTAREVTKYVANKMVFIDFNDVLFFNLYIGRGQDMIILRYQLQHLNNYMRTVFQKTPARYFKEMLQSLLRYLMLLSSLGAQLGVQSDDFFKNPIILQQDIREIINFFCPKDKDGREVGLSKLVCEQQSEAIFRFLQYMREDDQMLIGLFKSIDTDVQRNKEMISRILYRRQTKDIDKFFEDYKTLFGK